MNFDFSRTDNPVETAKIKLQTVYKLEADSSYDVSKKLKNRRELILLRTTGGKGILKFEESSYEASTNSLIVFKHSEIRRYYCPSNKWDFWWFEFNLEGMLPLSLNVIYDIKSEDNERCRFNNCLELIRKNDKTAKTLASSILTNLVYHWNYVLKNSEKLITPGQEAVNKVINYLYNHIEQNITVKEMARISGFSIRRFRQLFKEIEEKTPKEYYDKMRIKKAVEMLNNTAMSIKEISSELGYSSPFHFSKAFKKAKGIAPSYYKESSSKT